MQRSSSSNPAGSTIWSVGHSTRELADFVSLLREHSIARLADVRRFPGSRRHPHFSAEALARSLSEEGIEYRHFAGLGGFRKPRPDSVNVSWTNAGFRGYADHMEGDEFRGALAELEGWASEKPTAFLCAEATPKRCHRQLLADALVVDGFEVVHILGPGRTERHALPPFARVVERRIVYDGRRHQQPAE